MQQTKADELLMKTREHTGDVYVSLLKKLLTKDVGWITSDAFLMNAKS